MTAKEKAEDILDKCYGVEVESVYFGVNHYLAKKFALIVVDEIIKSKELNYLFTQNQIYSMEVTSDDRWIYEEFMKYWQEVKQEIEK
jgi:hypothetical protein